MSEKKPSIDEINALHEAIEDENIEEVEKLLKTIPYDKHYFNEDGISAASVASKLKTEDIYALLASKRIVMGPKENFDIDDDEKDKRRNLRNIHRKYFTDSNLKHLLALNNCSKLTNEVPQDDRRQYTLLIVNAFEDLNSLESIEPILKVASTFSSLEIAFDFYRDSVKYLEVTRDDNTKGSVNTNEAYISIGAKGLISDGNARNDVLGHLIHELTHFVLQFVYENDTNPYRAEDQEMADEFEKVFKKTEAKKDDDDYVKVVYDEVYSDDERHAELIVRVPHLTALYRNNKVKYEKVSEKFIELFEFYEKFTLTDLNRAFPEIKAKHEIREANELCGISTMLESSEIEMTNEALDIIDFKSHSNDDMLFISTNCPQLAMRAIFLKFQNDKNFESKFIFADLKIKESEAILDRLINAHKLCTNPTAFIQCESGKKAEAVKGIITLLRSADINQKVVFILDKSFTSFTDLILTKIDFEWDHLTKPFQQKLLKRKIIFQGIEMELKTLLDDLTSVSSIPFQSLFDKETITISEDLILEGADKLIDRKFLPENNSLDVRKIFLTMLSPEGPDYSYIIEYDFEKLFDTVKKNQTILLSDDPGMGKSTSFRMMQLKLRNNLSVRWIFFMDLKKYVKAFKENAKRQFKSSNEIANFFSNHILKIDNFDAQIFTHLFTLGRVVLLMDGLDEIVPTFKDFIFRLITDITKLSQNQLWISTRRHLVKDVVNAVKPIVFTLKPFTEADRREFFAKHLANDENLDEKLKEIENFCGSLNPSLNYRPIVNPIVMNMIAEIIEEDKNLKLAEANLYAIYDRWFTKKMVKRSLNSGTEAQHDVAKFYGDAAIVDFYQKVAFTNIFSTFNDDNLIAQLIHNFFEYVETPTINEITRVGLVFVDDSNNYQFVHQTFAEFYIVKFIFMVIFKPSRNRTDNEINKTVELLTEYILIEDFKNGVTFMFIKSLLESALDSLEKDKDYKRKTLEPSTVQLMESKLTYENFSAMVDAGLINLIRTTVLHFAPNSQKLLFTSGKNETNLLLKVVGNKSLHFINSFLTFLENISPVEFKKMLSMRNHNDENLFYSVVSNEDSKVFELMIQICEKTDLTKDELVSLLTQLSKNKRSVLHVAVAMVDNFLPVINAFVRILNDSQLKDLLSKVNDDRENILHLAFNHIRTQEAMEALLTQIRKHFSPHAQAVILMQKDKENFKPFDYALKNKNETVYSGINKYYLEIFGEDKIKKLALATQNKFFRKRALYHYEDNEFKKNHNFLEELFKDSEVPSMKDSLNTKNKKSETPLMFASRHFGENDYSTLLKTIKNKIAISDRVKILLSTNSFGECALHFGAKNESSLVFKEIWRFYKNNFDDSKLREIIVACRKGWLLKLLDADSGQQFEVVQILSKYLIDLFKGHEEAEKLKDFFFFANKSGKTVLMRAAYLEFEEVFEGLLVLCKELFDDKIKEFLLREQKDGTTALYWSVKSYSDRTFGLVKNIYNDYLTKEENQQLFSKPIKRSNILKLSIREAVSESIFKELCNHSINLFDDQKEVLENMITSLDTDDMTALMLASEGYGDHNEILVDLIEKLFGRDKEKLKKILIQKNRKGATALHYSIKIFGPVASFYLRELNDDKIMEILSSEVDWQKLLGNKIFRNLKLDAKKFFLFLKNPSIPIKGYFSDSELTELFFKAGNKSSPKLSNINLET